MTRGILAAWVTAAGLALAVGCDAPAPANAPADAPADEAAAAGTTPAEPPAAAPADEAAESDDLGGVDERALEIVRRAVQHLRDQERIAVTVHTDYDAVQDTGEQIEFGSMRRILIRRPDRMRIEAQPRDAGPRVTTFDGRLLTVLDVQQNAWAQVERAGDIDATIDFIEDDLATSMPLAELFRAEASRDLVSDLRSAYIAGTVNLDGVRCHHVFLRNDRADGQFWIEQGDSPRIHRITLTYRNDPGQPALRARYSDWNFTPDAGDERFQFAPPAGSDRILFAARPRANETEEQ